MSEPIDVHVQLRNLSVGYDSDLISGLIIQVGSIMVDTSLRTKLNKLEKSMLEA